MCSVLSTVQLFDVVVMLYSDDMMIATELDFHMKYLTPHLTMYVHNVKKKKKKKLFKNQHQKQYITG